MEAIVSYILISTICLSICYMVYVLYQHKETRLKHLRAFLMCSMLTAMILPFSKVTVDLPDNLKVDEKIIDYYTYLFEPGKIHAFKDVGAEALQQNRVYRTNGKSSMLNETNLRPDNFGQYYSDAKHKTNVSDKAAFSLEDQAGNSGTTFETNWLSVLTGIYLIGFAFLLLRMLFSLAVLFRLYFVSAKKRQDGFTMLINDSVKAPYSFFGWVFIPQKMFEENDYSEIILHEKVHVSQYHSIDIIVIELLSAVMWFNPFVWKMRNSVQLVHEYLADEGVLNTGIDRLQYQALLVNQVAEERLICLSSGFHQSQIKKRLIMMTKNKTDQNPKLRILYLLPIVLLLFIGVAYVNGQKKATTGNNLVTETNNKSEFAGQFDEESYNRLVKDKIFIMLGDRFISKKEYLSIDANNVESITMTGFYDKEKFMNRLKETSTDNYTKFKNGDYGGGMVITLKNDKQVSNEESKFSSWFTEKCYEGFLKENVTLIIAGDKVIRTKEEYLSINPINVDSIYLDKLEDGLKFKARIKDNYDVYTSKTEKKLAMQIIFKKNM